MTISKKIENIIAGSSFIRKMFEEGARLKAQFGAENVFDFSLGNPNLPPPEKFNEVLRETVGTCGLTDHCYMPNTGYPVVCGSVAEYLAGEQQAPVTPQDVIMTCGAAGALNVALKAVLDAGDEVLTPIPCFVEYKFYADNHGGVLKTVPTKTDFELDPDAISAAITEKTKVFLINSPNNPTGQVYSARSLKRLGEILEQKGREFNRTLYLLSDEPYRKIVYDGCEVPSIFKAYKNSIIGTSYSKDISIPGERIGFLAVNPAAVYRQDLLGALAVANRILGYVNAPALMQRVVACMQGLSVDISEYARKRDMLCDGLASLGYEFIKPRGAFYLFPVSPIADDVEFVNVLKEERILVVPGTGFNGPGFFRIAFCTDDSTIENSMPGFERAIKKFR
ncbi:MAG: pyridoxal phosphate-dependent aminotransferase [Deltaproteobacteria bacterium]|jgi:aspartate aminotransferase|nr:pyridoxal phosphate-dependent aminotransferase [Deltaproteobacteria bacterium]